MYILKCMQVLLLQIVVLKQCDPINTMTDDIFSHAATEALLLRKKRLYHSCKGSCFLTISAKLTGVKCHKHEVVRVLLDE